MATFAPIPIPPGLDLCGSFVDQQFFIQIVNMNLELIIQALQATTSTTITLPGVPAWNIGIPGFTLPGIESREIGYANERPDLTEGWIGGRFPFKYPPQNISGEGRIAGTSDIAIPSETIGVQGFDPYVATMENINYNYEILVKQVPSLSTVAILVPVWNPCKAPPQPAAVAQAINAINDGNQQIINTINNGGTGCVPGSISSNLADTMCWSITATQSGVIVSTSSDGWVATWASNTVASLDSGASILSGLCGALIPFCSRITASIHVDYSFTQFCQFPTGTWDSAIGASFQLMRAANSVSPFVGVDSASVTQTFSPVTATGSADLTHTFNIAPFRTSPSNVWIVQPGAISVSNRQNIVPFGACTAIRGTVTVSGFGQSTLT